MNRFRIGLSAFAVLAGAAFAAFPACGYEVSADTMVVNPGQHVAVPVRFDTVEGASHVSVRIAYDPHVLVLLKVAEGPLTRTLSDDFVTVADEKSGEVTVSAFGVGNVTENVGGVLATLQFAVRENTQSLYSDIAIANVKIGEASGVKDVTVANPIRSVNGMVRVVASSDAVTRLDQPQTIGADAVLGALSLKAGDALQASDSQGAIRVAGAVTKEDAVIAVKAPVNGWASGDYALISTSSDGLGLALADLPAETSVTYYSKTEGGVVTYFANVIIAGELPVVADGGESLTAGTMNLIRNNARLSFEGKSDELSLHRKDLSNKRSAFGFQGLREWCL